MPQNKTQPDILRPDWLTRPQTQKLFSVLGADSLRAVGGCVRDTLRQVAVIDVDMATTWPPEAVMEKLQAADIRVIPTGLAHGTVTVIIDGFRYEITSLRQDIETDGRHARVIFGTDWDEDAARRDFTINALYLDAAGRLYDPLGAGLADVQAGCVRFIGEAAQRIAEDYLRVLRFFRFHYLLTPPPPAVPAMPDASALLACRQAAQEGHGLQALSAERLQAEFFRILLLPQASAAITAMQQADVLPFILPFTASPDGASDIAAPDSAPIVRLQHLQLLERQMESPDALRRLAVLLPDMQQAKAAQTDTAQADAAQTDTAQAGAVIKHLHLSNKHAKRLKKMLSHIPPIDISDIPMMTADKASDVPPDEVIDKSKITPVMRPALYRLGRENFIDSCFLTAAGQATGQTAGQATGQTAGQTAGQAASFWLSLIRLADSIDIPVFPVDGAFLQAQGIAPGPEMGRLAALLETWWIDHDFPSDMQLLAAQLARIRQDIS